MGLDDPPFEWGVASGDPTTSSIILWTRVKIEEPVKVFISTDKSMEKIVKTQATDEGYHPSESNDLHHHLYQGGIGTKGSLRNSNWIQERIDVMWGVNYIRATMAKANPHHAFLDLSQHMVMPF
eukprot:785920_1